MKFYKSIEAFALLALISFPAFILVNRYIAGATFLLSMLLGCLLFIRQRKFLPALSQEEVFFLLSLSLLTCSLLITAAVNQVELTKLDRLIMPLLGIPVYFLYRGLRLSEGWLWCGLAVGAVMAGLVALYQMMPGAGFDRAGGITNPIMFGDISLVMGFMSMAGCGWFFQQRRWVGAMPFVALVFGLLASALSLSRGGWLSLPLALLLLSWFFARRLSWQKMLFAVFFVIAAVALIYQAPQSKVKQRVELTLNNLQAYQESTNVDDPVRLSGLGIRLDMWKTSLHIFAENPFFGVGWGAYAEAAREYVELGLVGESVALFPHPHNQFLSALAKGGVFGLLALLLFMGIPLFLFSRQLLNPAASEETRRVALAAVLFLLSFIAFAVTEAVFERSRMMTFYAFYLLVLMALMQVSARLGPVSQQDKP